MVTISETASVKVKEILKAEGKPDWGLRIYTVGSGCCGPSYGMGINENPSEGDVVVEKDGLKVFFDKETLESLGDRIIDYMKDDNGEGFIVTGGQAPSCGPGCSSCG